jgi:hypothetical protein
MNSPSVTLKLLQLMPKESVCGISVEVGAAFAGAGLTGLTETAANSSAPASAYGPTLSLMSASSQVNGAVALTPGGVVETNLVASGANLSTVSSGTVDFNICVVSQ